MLAASTLRDAEELMFIAALARHDGDKQRAAELLGISLRTPYARLERYGPATDS